MFCRLPAAVHVPLNSCHAEYSEAEAAGAGEAAPGPASISATRERNDLRTPSVEGRPATLLRLPQPITPFRSPHRSAVKRDMRCLPVSSKRDTCTEPKSQLDVDQR